MEPHWPAELERVPDWVLHRDYVASFADNIAPPGYAYEVLASDVSSLSPPPPPLPPPSPPLPPLGAPFVASNNPVRENDQQQQRQRSSHRMDRGALCGPAKDTTAEETLTRAQSSPSGLAGLKPIRQTGELDWEMRIPCYRSRNHDQDCVPLYSGMATTKKGYCVSCKQMHQMKEKREENKCPTCAKKLAMQYVRWLPHLKRIDGEVDDQFPQENTLLIHVNADSPDLNIIKTHIVLGYDVGVFRGTKEFHTGDSARKFLRDCGYRRFRKFFPRNLQRPDRKRDRFRVCDAMNQEMIDESVYFFAHKWNIEAYYHPPTVAKAVLQKTFNKVVQDIETGQSERPRPRAEEFDEPHKSCFGGKSFLDE